MIASWLTLEEFLAAAGVSRRTFFNNRAQYETKKNGRKLLIASASLPESARAKLETLSDPRKELLRPLQPSQATAPLFANGMALQGPGRRLVLRPEQERQAVQRLHILQPLLDFCTDTNARSRFQLLQLGDGTAVRTADHLAEYLAQTHSTEAEPISRPTLWRWKKRYEADGLNGLARKLREDKGVSKWAQRWPQAAKLATATYLQPWQSKQTAYDAVVRDRELLGMPEHELPSYAAVCDFLSTLPQAPVVLAREGEKAHSQRFASYLSRGYTDIAPMDVMVSDHAIHDVEVRNDCFFGVPDGAPMRLRLTAMMDLRSRMVVGYTWTPEGNSRSISTALRNAVQRYGAPKTFYCDNGKDFQKVGRFARPVNEVLHVEQDVQEIQKAGVLLMLGIKVQFCIKYHPQSKPIERMFRTLHLGLDAILPHYTTGNAYTRPDRIERDGTQHRKLLRMDRAHLSPLLPASDFIRMAQVWIEEDYNQRHKHSGRGMGGRTPSEVFNDGWSPETRRTVDSSILDTLLWTREKRLVRNCAVTVSNRRLIGKTPSDVEILHRAGETEVQVCFDPNAPETAVITSMDGIKLCDVRAERYVTQSAEAGPMIAASLQERRGLRNNDAASIRNLRRDVAKAGHKTDAEHLFIRAQQVMRERGMADETHLLPMAVGDHITQRVMTDAPHRAAAPRYAHEIAMAAAMEDE